MNILDIRSCKNIRLMGRFDASCEGLPLNWTGSGFEAKVRASRLDVEITASYHTYRPYISFIVDGLTAQTFSPLPGTHVYTVFFSLSSEKAHSVRLILETQLFPGDGSVTVTRLITDGDMLPLDERTRRIEFIGDSITSGEGIRGPKDFQEWVPMMFSASDNYTNYTARKLNADYQVVSQSGWGVMCAWNNDPECNIPRIYEMIANDGKEYDFSFDPDCVVVALGTNDHSALNQTPFTRPDGSAYKLSLKDMPAWTDEAHGFIRTIHARNPHARIIWISFYENTPITQALDVAAERAQKEGIDVCHESVLNLNNLPRGGMGSRTHPGVVSHRRIAQNLVRLIKNGRM